GSATPGAGVALSSLCEQPANAKARTSTAEVRLLSKVASFSEGGRRAPTEGNQPGFCRSRKARDVDAQGGPRYGPASRSEASLDFDFAEFIKQAVMVLVPMILCLAVLEYSHAVVSQALVDDDARMLVRV